MNSDPQVDEHHPTKELSLKAILSAPSPALRQPILIKRSILPAPTEEATPVPQVVQSVKKEVMVESDDGQVNTPTVHRCEICGKSYKNRNCLLKHGWEHHDQWANSSDVCASKHQQVQLMEAAQLLVEIGRGKEGKGERGPQR